MRKILIFIMSLLSVCRMVAEENMSSEIFAVSNSQEFMRLLWTETATSNDFRMYEKNFDVFKVKAPLLNISPITSQIGMKEGMTAKSRYEVLEVIEDERGHIEYKRVGVIKPVADKIWDNRFMAVEEGAENATLGYTTFEKVSGGDFYSGMLIREIK